MSILLTDKNVHPTDGQECPSTDEQQCHSTDGQECPSTDGQECPSTDGQECPSYCRIFVKVFDLNHLAIKTASTPLPCASWMTESNSSFLRRKDSSDSPSKG